MKKCALALVLCWNFAFPCFAQVGVAISETNIEISLGRGHTKTFSFDLTNNSNNKNLDFKIYPLDIEMDRKGSVQFVEAGTVGRSCSKWLHIKNDTINIAPNESGKVILKLAVPPDASSGGYYGVVICEIVDNNKTAQKGLGIGFRFAVFLKAIVYGGRIEKMARIEEFSFNTVLDTDKEKEDNEKQEIDGEDGFQRLYFKAVFKNESNIHLSPAGRIIIFTNDKKRVGEAISEEALVLPGHIRDFIILYDKPLLEGDYLARATFRYKGQRPLVKEIPLSIKAQSGQKGLGDGNQLTISSLNTPKELRIKAVSGAFRSKGFTVRNQKREPLEVGVSLEGEAASWSKIEPRSLRIESAKSKRVLLTVNVPYGTAKGNYLGKIKLLPALAGENSTQGLEPQEVEVIIEVREF